MHNIETGMLVRCRESEKIPQAFIGRVINVCEDAANIQVLSFSEQNRELLWCFETLVNVEKCLIQPLNVVNVDDE
ncbi:hypothetical protein EQG49_00890 [Periweissella cryptocerci]|uniref:Uncharacterized protein n=1 Tax=Periweissella cryptocerci TaxID=2506420 RepID=A0A4P6YR70_9LACO|nr:hypothetical protein [Periweissella cryptocerci]QBO35110.1 hypothetical protein EQG49_00890 [Periweissella cryptocerci]